MLLKVYISAITGVQSKLPCYVSVSFRDIVHKTIVRRNVLNEFIHELFKWETQDDIREDEMVVIAISEKGSFFCDKILGKYTLCLAKVVNDGYQAISDHCINDENLQTPLRITFDINITHSDQQVLKKASYFNVCNFASYIGSYFWCGKPIPKYDTEPGERDDEKFHLNEDKKQQVKYGAMF
ncbi:otoferlin-like protein [Dinothrombium tinctorium]|uniref:Otoferlin-like protein n=1 Tax=Dinothrombium tinctorium TaxID=1965070 RepID=A0A3S3PHL3_9ACAR|nr:otoferlin-like protein [Dinothrombium tinctorium]RWS13949.1 otoferlin-like protein [Dinothrombium tinctorium]RWS15429.1 otoferlin-like protein [Dinothrombium tinctorium]